MAMLTALPACCWPGIKVAAADYASRLGAWPVEADRHGRVRTSRVPPAAGQLRLTPSTDQPVMGRLADYSCFVS
jgi:hypothetical protein